MKKRVMMSVAVGLGAAGLVLGAIAGAADNGQSALVSYGDSHPQCRQWTDWKSLCSRRFGGQSPHCVQEPNSAYRAAQPFCVLGEDGGTPWKHDLAEKRATEHFCAEYAFMTGPAVPGNVPYLACKSFVPDRPFNGLRLASRRDPACGAWMDGATGRPVCSETPAPGQPSCEALARAGYVSANPLVCAKWKPSPACPRPADMFARAWLPSDGTQPPGPPSLASAPKPEWIPAIGTICLER